MALLLVRKPDCTAYSERVTNQLGFRTGAGVENTSDNFHLESLFPIPGLFDPRNEVLVCTAAPRTVPFRFQYTDKPQAVQVQSCFREPCALFASTDQCYKWMGWYPFSAGKQWIIDAQSGETHHTSLSSDGKLLCPRSSIRRHIASVWVYLVHKYPSLRRQLEGYLSWEVALNWLKLPVTLRELFMDLYSQRLMGDLNPWCYAPDRVELVRKPGCTAYQERATNQGGQLGFRPNDGSRPRRNR